MGRTARPPLRDPLGSEGGEVVSTMLSIKDRIFLVAYGVIIVLAGCALGFAFGFFVLGPLYD